MGSCDLTKIDEMDRALCLALDVKSPLPPQARWRIPPLDSSCQLDEGHFIDQAPHSLMDGSEPRMFEETLYRKRCSNADDASATIVSNRP